MSATCGFITGNRLMHIFLVASIGALIFAGLGFGVYSVFEKKVPEFLDFLADIGGGVSMRQSDRDFESSGGQSSEGEIKISKGEESMSGDFGGGDLPGQKRKDGKYGDHIVVNNIAIKNEPKLMAEAIRTIMSQDESETPRQ